MTYANLSVFGLSIACFFSFNWAAFKYFKVREGIPASMRALSSASLLGYLSFWIWGWHAHWESWQIVTADVIFAAALWLFWSALRASRPVGLHVAHSNAVSQSIATQGPYQYLRHPFYVSYCMCWVVTAVLDGPVLWAFALLFILWYSLLAVQEEKALLRSELGARYRTYLAESGAFKWGGVTDAGSKTLKTSYRTLLAGFVASFRSR